MHRFARRPHHLLPLIVALALLALASPALAAPAGTTVLVSRPDGNAVFTPPKDGPANMSAPLAVSDDGRYVAFVSAQPGLDPAAAPFVMNVFLRDTVANTTTLVSRSDGFNGVDVNTSAGTGGDVYSSDTLSIALQPFGATGDAPHNQTHVLVTFSTKAANLVDHTSQKTLSTGKVQVWMRDVTAGTTYLVSRANGLTGAPADGDAYEASMAASPSGPLVAYTSISTNLYPPRVTGSERAVYLREVGTGVDHRVDTQTFCSFDTCTDVIPFSTSDQPSLRFVTGSSANAMCGAGQSCAIVAFASPNAAVLHTFPANGLPQIVGARAVLKADGTLDEFDHFEVASATPTDSPQLGNAESSEPKLPADGRSVLFLSGATNFPKSLPGTLGVDAYSHFWGLRHLGSAAQGQNPATHVFELPNQDISHIAVGGPAAIPRVAAVTIATNWAMLPPPVGPFHVYAGDDRTGGLTLRDANVDGTPGNGLARGIEVSADGKTIVYASSSTNLGGGSSLLFTRVYKQVVDSHDPAYNKPQLVSRPTGGGTFPQGDTTSDITSRATSGDGRFVAFQTVDSDLVPQNANGAGVQHVFVRDTVNGTTTLVDRAGGAGGAPADTGAILAGISEDGRRVMFTSGAANLCSGCNRNVYAYVRDLSASTTTVVSRVNGPTGEPVGVRADSASLSGDGTHAAFITPTPLDPKAVNDKDHVYVRDIANGTTTFADRDTGAKGDPAGADAFEVALNRDGSKVAWQSETPFLGANVLDATHMKIYVRDLTAGTTVLASRADGAAGATPNADALHPAIDAAGDVVAYQSAATNLGSVDRRSIWVRRLNTNQTLLASVAGGAGGAPADGISFAPSIDASGDKVAFVSNSGNLGTNGNVQGEAYVHSFGAKTTDLVSRVNGVNGAPAVPGGGTKVSISANGACAAFSGLGLNYTDPLAPLPYPAVRERAMTASCGAGTGALTAAVVDDTPPAVGLDAPAAPPAPAPAVAAAALTRLSASPARFFVGAQGGTKLSFALGKASTVTIAFERLLAGRAHGGRCLELARTGKPCTLVRPAGRLTVRAHAGVNRIRFSGRVGRRALAPGSYRWTATPLHGRARSGRFAVVRAPRSGAPRHGH
jgi:hypothetical protein